MANTLDRYKTIKIDGKEYRFQYTIRSIIDLEKKLDSKSILSTISEPPLSFSDSFNFFKYGLVGGGTKIKDDEEAETLMLCYLDENNLGELQTLILETLMISGTLGKTGKEKNA